MAELDQQPNEFELARKRAAQQSQSAVQGQQDAIKRRFAALGSINSGAAIKQGQLAAESGQAQLAQANEGIDAAQRAETRRVKEIQEGRDFAKSERLGSQEFAGLQAELGRKFQSGEAELGRRFQSGERLSAQDFAARQAANDMAFREKVFANQNAQFKQQFDFSREQFEEDKRTTEFNKRIAEMMANKKNGGVLDSIFGEGFMGGSIGEIGKVVANPIGAITSGRGGFF